MHFAFDTPLVVPLLLASMHGTTDFAKPAHRLAPYAALVCWPAALPVTPVFVCASVVHFRHDVGVRTSVAMHAAFVLGAAAGRDDAAFALFAAYFCLVHTPMHYWRHRGAWRYPVVATALCALCLAACQPLPHEVVLTDWMQRLVVAHIACDEADGGGRGSAPGEERKGG